MPTIRPVALVTGASSGIGEALARCLAADGYDLVLVARGSDGLARAYETLSGEAGVATFALDLQECGAGDRLERELGDRRIDLLVNNAGYGVTGPFLEQPRETQLGEIGLNVEALTDLTHRFLGRMLRGASAEASSMWPRRPRFSPGHRWRSTTRPRPTSCRSPRPSGRN